MDEKSSSTHRIEGERPAQSAVTDSAVAARLQPPYVALTGNPNCGKTTLFNALTGLRAKVGNYAGVTVERKEGRLRGGPSGKPIIILDLPGTYSLSPKSLDEQISRDVLFGLLPEIPPPSAVVVIVDASNLERNLYYATQVIELGYPTVIALNMIDVAEENGHVIDAQELSHQLGVPVVPMVASIEQGVAELREQIVKLAYNGAKPADRHFLQHLSADAVSEIATIADALAHAAYPPHVQFRAHALLALMDEHAPLPPRGDPSSIRSVIDGSRKRLEARGIDWRSCAIEARYARVAEIHRGSVQEESVYRETFSDKLDRILTHKLWGVLIFIFIMGLMFQSIFVFAHLPMDALQGLTDAAGKWIERTMPPGDLNSLIVDGVVAGVGAVVVFLPQILLLFLFIGFLEDTGYMARAAFLMDRVMSKVGLHGKSFIPMLSSFACAIPGIMATRTIESPKDRLVTILVAPLMSCSARLPVYTLLIAACIPDRRVFGIVTLAGLTLLVMYLLGIIVALFMAWIFKSTLLKGETPMLILELPPYKRPVFKIVCRHMWDRSKLFLIRAGTVILGINILLWFLATYPRNAEVTKAYEARRSTLEQSLKSQNATLQQSESAKTELDNEEAGEKLRRSFAGHIGRLIEPVIAPLGFDWKIGIGIVASFAAREVFVSTMSTVYNVGESKDKQAMTSSLSKIMQQQKRPNGKPFYTPLLGIALMVFYVFAMQCASTVAIVRRETNSWKWPLFQWVYMGVLAWTLAFMTYQGGRLLGLE